MAVCSIITGHEKGELIVWEQTSNEYRKLILKSYLYEVVQIEISNDTMMVATFSSNLDIWSIEFKLLRTIDMTSLGVKLFGYEIMHFAPVDCQGEIIVMTNNGDMVRLNNVCDKTRSMKPTRLNIVKIKGG
jgi:hypothetical protein